MICICIYLNVHFSALIRIGGPLYEQCRRSVRLETHYVACLPDFSFFASPSMGAPCCPSPPWVIICWLDLRPLIRCGPYHAVIVRRMGQKGGNHAGTLLIRPRRRRRHFFVLECKVSEVDRGSSNSRFRPWKRQSRVAKFSSRRNKRMHLIWTLSSTSTMRKYLQDLHLCRYRCIAQLPNMQPREL